MGCCGSQPKTAPPVGVDPDEWARKQKEQLERSHNIDNLMKTDDKSEKIINKLLLLGTGSSGKTTLFKALKSVHNQGMDRSELLDTRHVVRQNVILGILILLQQSQELFDSNPNEHSDCQIIVNDDLRKIIQIIVNNANNQFIDIVDWKQMHFLGQACKLLWHLPQIQATFRKRGGRFSFPDNLDYFFDKIEIIMRQDYIPSEEDSLKTRIRTTGMVKYLYEDEKGHTFHMYDVGGQRNERKKWIHHFENVNAVLFVTALNHYNAVLFEDNRTNSMLEAVDLFYEIISNKWFRRAEIILFLNKDDLFRIKLKDEEVPLTVCFSGEANWPIEDEWYDGPNYFYDTRLSDEQNQEFFDRCYDEAIKFIKQVFENRKEWAIQNTRNNSGGYSLPKDKVIFQHVTCATDNLAVQQVFWDVQNIVIRANLKKGGLMT